MALSMEEERILAEIALQLSEDDPRLARRMVAFRGKPRRRGIRTAFKVVIACLLIVSLIGAAFMSAVPV
jgi:hypothetical protein